MIVVDSVVDAILAVGGGDVERDESFAGSVEGEAVELIEVAVAAFAVVAAAVE